MWDKSAFIVLYVVLSVASSTASPLSHYGMARRADQPRVFRNDTTTTTSVTSQERSQERSTTSHCLTCTTKTESMPVPGPKDSPSSTTSAAGKEAPSTAPGPAVPSSVTSSAAKESSKQESFSATTTVTIVWPPPPITDGRPNSNDGKPTSTPTSTPSSTSSSKPSTTPAASTDTTSSAGRSSAPSDSEIDEVSTTTVPETKTPAQKTPQPTSPVGSDTNKSSSSSSKAQSTAASTNQKAPEKSPESSPSPKEEDKSSTSTIVQQSSTPAVTPTPSTTRSSTGITAPVTTTTSTSRQESESSSSSSTSTNDSPNVELVPGTKTTEASTSSSSSSPAVDSSISSVSSSRPSSVSSASSSETPSSIASSTEPALSTSEAKSGSSTITSTITTTSATSATSTSPVTDPIIPIEISFSGSTGPVSFGVTLVAPSETLSGSTTSTPTSASDSALSSTPTPGSSTSADLPSTTNGAAFSSSKTVDEAPSSSKTADGAFGSTTTVDGSSSSSTTADGASSSTGGIGTPIPVSEEPSTSTASVTDSPVTGTSVAGITPTGAFGTGFIGTGHPAETILEPTRTPGKNSTNGEGKDGHSTASPTNGPGGSSRPSSTGATGVKGGSTSTRPDPDAIGTGIAPPSSGNTDGSPEDGKKKDKDGNDDSPAPLTTSQAAGIAIGSTACALIALVAVLFVIRRRRNQKKDRYSTGSVYPEVAYLYDPQIPEDKRGSGGAGGLLSRRITGYDAVPNSPQWNYSFFSQPYRDRSPSPLLPSLPPQKPGGPIVFNPAAAEYPPLSPYKTKMPELTPLPAIYTNLASNPFQEEEDIILDIEPGTETPDSLVVLAVPPPTPRTPLHHRSPAAHSLSTPESTPPQGYSPPQPEVFNAVAVAAPRRHDINIESFSTTGPTPIHKGWDEVKAGFDTQTTVLHKKLPSTMLAHSPPPDSVLDEDWTSISFPSPDLPPALPPKPLKIAAKKPPNLSVKPVGHGAGQSLLLSGVGLPLTIRHDDTDSRSSSQRLERGLGLEIPPMGKVYGRNGVFSPTLVDDEWNPDPVVQMKRSGELGFARRSLIGRPF